MRIKVYVKCQEANPKSRARVLRNTKVGDVLELELNFGVSRYGVDTFSVTNTSTLESDVYTHKEFHNALRGWTFVQV